MDGETAPQPPDLGHAQPDRAQPPHPKAPPAEAEEARESSARKLRFHVEGAVEPWSQRPDLQQIVPLDLTDPAPASVEDEATSLLTAARELRHLAEMGELIPVVAREIRNPLAGIAAIAEVLRQSLDPGDERAGSVDSLLDEVQRLDALVSDLLDVARSREPRLMEADVAEDVDRVVRSLAADARAAGVEVRAEAPDVPTPVRIDSELTQHVFRHLVTNALQAMPQGGSLTVRTWEPDLDSTYVCVTFTDTGAGVGSEDPARLFEPFYRTRRDGVGLGLAAARRLIEVQGGHITVESVPGRGACFAVYLPRADVSRS
ncbi:MAG: sensor histidine kinase [bacterium]